MKTQVADVIQFEKHVAGQLLLRAEIPLFNIRREVPLIPASQGPRVAWKQDIGLRADGRRPREAALAQDEAARWQELVANDRLRTQADKGRVVGEPVRQARAFVLCVENAISRPDHQSLYAGYTPSQPDSWTQVLFINL